MPQGFGRVLSRASPSAEGSFSLPSRRHVGRPHPLLGINYANEVLQQQFNADVFRQQQKEYDAEGIPWQHIEYQDNGPVLELIRGKRDGICLLYTSPSPRDS